MAWKHRLTNKDIINKTAICSKCGPVKLYRIGRGRYRCGKAIQAEKMNRKYGGRVNPGVCELCTSTKQVAFDHDHLTGTFRGWLCINCNTVLGLVHDDVAKLEALIVYLKKQPLS